MWFWLSDRKAAGPTRKSSWRRAAGFRSASLGQLILRTETAVIAALASLRTRWSRRAVSAALEHADHCAASQRQRETMALRNGILRLTD